MTKTDELKGRIICQGWYYLNGVKTCPHSPCINTGGYECSMNLTDNYMKTDELISKLEEALQLSKEVINNFVDPGWKGIYPSTRKIKILESGIYELKEQIKKEEVNPDVMPDTCCGKYEEDIIGFDVIKQHNKKCFDDTLENIKKSMKDKEQPLKSAEEILLEVYGCKTVKEFNKCFDISREMITEVCKRYHDQFQVATVKDISNIPYPNPTSKHQTDINIGWIRAMEYIKDQSVKDITDEEILNAEMDTFHEYVQKGHTYIGGLFSEGAKWMRDKMKSL